MFDTEGKPLRGTLVEIWQANAAGRYRHRWDRWPAPLDPNFTGAGRCVTDDEGRYQLHDDQARARTRGATTTTPGGRRTSTSRCSGRAFTQRLVTQMYFPGDPLFPYDPIFNSVARSERRASGWSRGSRSTGRGPNWAPAYEFDIYLRGPGATPFEEAH